MCAVILLYADGMTACKVGRHALQDAFSSTFLNACLFHMDKFTRQGACVDTTYAKLHKVSANPAAAVLNVSPGS